VPVDWRCYVRQSRDAAIACTRRLHQKRLPDKVLLNHAEQERTAPPDRWSVNKSACHPRATGNFPVNTDAVHLVDALPHLREALYAAKTTRRSTLCAATTLVMLAYTPFCLKFTLRRGSFVYSH